MSFRISYKVPSNLVVFMFHDIVKKEKRCFRPCDMSVDSFRRIIKKIDANYNVISARSLINKEFKEGDDIALITFDDGLKGVYENAFPILLKKNIPALLFITTGFLNDEIIPYERIIHFIGRSKSNCRMIDGSRIVAKTFDEKIQKLVEPVKNSTFNKREIYIEKLLNQNDLTLSEVKKNGPYSISTSDLIEMNKNEQIEVGSHTHYHQRLKFISPLHIYQDVKKGVEQIEKLIGESPDYFAYPYGACTALTQLIIMSLRFEMAFGTWSRPTLKSRYVSKYNIPRIDASSLKIS